MAGSYGPNVINGELQYLSPSGISKYDPEQPGGCPFKGRLHYVEKLKEEFTGANALGVSTHKELQRHIETGEMCLGGIALTAKQFIPTRTKHLKAEHKIERDALTVAGVRVVGEIDVLDLGWQGEILTIDEYGDQVTEYATTEVLDWKTTSNVAKWSKPADKLMRTVQMPLYGKYALTVTPNADFVRLSHVYMQTRGAPCSTKETLRVSRQDIDTRWGEIESLARSIKDYVKEPDINKIPRNRNACNAWGKRCMHANTFCAKGVIESVDDIFGITKATQLKKGNTKMDLDRELAELEAGASAAGAFGEAAPAVTVPETFLQDWADIVSAEKGFPPLDAAASAVFQTANGLPVTGECLPGEGDYGALSPLPTETVLKLAQNLRNTGAAKPAPVIPVEAAVTLSLEAQPTIVKAPPVVEPPAVPATGEPEDVTTCREMIKDPKWSGQKISKPELSQVVRYLMGVDRWSEKPVTDEDIDHEAIRALRVDNDDLRRQLAEAVAANADFAKACDDAPPVGLLTDGLVLYIDAIPSEPFDRIDDYKRKMCGLLEKQCSAKDIRCSDDDRLSFGKWRGALAACVRAMPLEDGVYFVDTRGDEISEVIATTLKEGAAKYSKGIQ